MNVSRIALSAIAVFILWSSPLQARDKQLYVSAGPAQYDFTLDHTLEVERGMGYFMMAGLEMKKGMALEFLYGDSGYTDFDYDGSTIKGGTLRLRHFGAYGVYRTPGTVYGKAKIGVSVNTLDAHGLDCPYSICTNTISKDDGAISYGLGAGVRLSDRFRTELEYTVVDEDVDIIQLGLLFSL